MHNIANQAKSLVNCDLSSLSYGGLRSAINDKDIAELEKHIHQVSVQRRNEHLFRAGARSDELFIVQSGCFKLYGMDAAGREYIPGFRLPGDILGVHSFQTGVYQYNAIALTDSIICRIKTNQLTELLGRFPNLLSAVMRMVGQEVFSHVFLTGSFTAEERVAAFLSNLEDRLQDHRLDGELHLPMTRSDIAVYLRLAMATVSRILSWLDQESIIECDYRTIRILDQERLDKLCENVPFIIRHADKIV